jgi:hypothetical protein
MKNKKISHIVLIPPKKQAQASKQNIIKLKKWMDQLITTDPHKGYFYSELDAYLGPFGEKGYFLGHGKKYTVALYDHPILNQNPAGKAWVKKTMILMQELIRNYIVSRFSNGTLLALNDNDVALLTLENSARIFDEGGMARIKEEAPELIPYILMVLKKEFQPKFSVKFARTCQQVTIALWNYINYPTS